MQGRESFLSVRKFFLAPPDPSRRNIIKNPEAEEMVELVKDFLCKLGVLSLSPRTHGLFVFLSLG